MQGGVQGAVAGAIGSVMPGVAQAGPAMPPMAAGSMAVSPGMTVSIPPPPDFVNGLTEMLTTALIQQNQFVVLERSHMNDVINEQTFAASGRVDPATVAQANKVLGAQALIFGDVTEYSQKQSHVGGNFNLLKKVAGQANATVSRVTAQVSVDLRLVDAATGQVLGAVRGQGKASATGLATQFQAMDRGFGAGGAAQTPLGQASREAIANAVAGVVRGLQSMKWSGRVVDVRGTQVYINAGATFGVSPGMTFEVFRQGDQLVDPDTHQSLGTPDQKIGSISVVTVAPGYSVANIVDGSGFQKADVVRFTGVGAAP
jgi:curli biogenesis system outer membrane secretion channel CsgG